MKISHQTETIIEGLGLLALIILIAALFTFVAMTCPPASVATAWMVAGSMAIVAAFQVYHLVSLFK